jgi:uncharacterized protein YcbX
MGTFPDDRRYALLKQSSSTEFDAQDPKWVHKEHFLCAFTAPQLMASYQSDYEILLGKIDVDSSMGLPNDATTDDLEATQRILTLYQRPKETHPTPVLGPIHLESSKGRDELASFFSTKSKQSLTCVTNEQPSSTKHAHQFGNTRSGIKHAKDTRTIHIINAATVRQFSNVIGVNLDPMRFRPNIIVDGLDPWKEFDLIGKTLTCSTSSISVGEEEEEEMGATGGDTRAAGTGVELKIISTTVRCAGVGVDPLDPEQDELDIPKLLSQHFPQHGPYLGVYAVIQTTGILHIGDSLMVLE